MAAKFADRIGRLENVLNERIEQLLDERESIQVDAICILIRAYTNQKGSNALFDDFCINFNMNSMCFVFFSFSRTAPKQTRIVDKLVNRLREICESDELIITNHTIQTVANSLNRIYIVVPKLCERMLKYVNENMDIVGANIASSLLFYLFSMGYEPYSVYTNRTLMADRNASSENLFADPDFDFATFIQIINRDFDFIPAYSIVQACLALSFFQALDTDLIQRVFNIDFVTRLEKDICSIYETVTDERSKIFSNFSTN